MANLHPTRRMATLGLTATAFAGLARIAHAVPGIAPDDGAAGYGPLVPDPAGLLDLPRGFSYRILSAFGDRMDDGLAVTDNADGMGCIALAGGRHALVRNHELSPQHGKRGAFAGASGDGPAYDQHGEHGILPGGTTTPGSVPGEGEMTP